MLTKLDADWLIDSTLGRLLPTAKAVESRVEDLRRQMPGASDEEISDRLISETAARAAAVGAGLSAPAEVPGVGMVLAWLGVPAELVILWRLQATLVLHIARVYGHNPQPHARTLEMLAVLGLATMPTVLGEEGVRSVITLGGTRLLRQVAARMGLRGLERVGARALGLLAVVADAGLNAASTYAVGRRAKAYFRRSPQLSAVSAQLTALSSQPTTSLPEGEN